MANKKIQVTLSVKIMEILEQLSEEMGLPKSSIVALAIEKYSREEGNRGKK